MKGKKYIATLIVAVAVLSLAFGVTQANVEFEEREVVEENNEIKNEQCGCRAPCGCGCRGLTEACICGG
ncbi:MAG: hypothetical protein JSV92_05015 [archaeon]|nr:MAG: hypothetical protein JSV92_05015 [archaeon]